MHSSAVLILFVAGIFQALAIPGSSPQTRVLSAVDAVPGESPLFTTYGGKKSPLAANYTKVISAAASGNPHPDDILFQNLLSAEWIIYSFYQQAVKSFSPSDFTRLGLPNTTYQRITEIRDNEAGHVRIFQDQISDNSVKPGPCKYQYGFGSNTSIFLALQVYLEVSSTAFLTGLAREASLNVSKSALMAIGQVESRHNAWSLIDMWNTTPFSGPSDTIYPYPNQILDLTNAFIESDSCPIENPVYPNPRQNLPPLAIRKDVSAATPGSQIRFVFSDPNNQPKFDEDKDYYAVFYHGINSISVPYDPKKNLVVIPAQFDARASIIIVSITDHPDVPSEDSVVAGPLIILEQPEILVLQELLAA
ncbi:hypothetical protein DTO027B9_5080 [Paecilomyces variotii]|nr:hypothetical protein DTO027B9_5080 [Paecilomyces variotii]